MPNYKISGLTAYPNSTFASTDRFEVSYYSGGIYYSRYLTGTQILATIPSGLTIGTTAITSGTVGCILFEGAGNVVQEDSTLFWDNTNKRLGVGATPSTSIRLDVRAQGALSTDKVFRLQNSANTVELQYVAGDGSYIYKNNANTGYLYYNASGGWEFLQSSVKVNLTIGTFTSFVSDAGATSIRFGSSTNSMVCYKTGNFQFEDASIVQTSGQGGISLKTGTDPSASTIDRFNMYSKDIVAGNAAPHFRLEGGDVIKLFKGAVLTTSDGTLANAVTRIGELEARLQALGLLA